MKRVLVVHPRLGTFRGARALAHRHLLDALGIHLILADDELDSDLAQLFSERIRLPAPERVEEAWSTLAPTLERERIDAVVAQSESGLLLGALAVRATGVRGISVDAAHLTANKFRSRLALAEAGVPQPDFALVSSLAEARRFAKEHGYPVVLKAVASARQRLVRLVRGPAELPGAVELLRGGLGSSSDVARLMSFARGAQVDLGCEPLHEFLIEAFAPGDPVETDGLVVRSEPLFFGVVEQVHAFAPDFFIEGYLLPAERPAAELATIEGVSSAAIRALGLRDSGFSIELRADGSVARIIEVNGRLGADEGFFDLFESVIGVHPALLAFQLALGSEPAIQTRRACAAVAYQACYEHGRIAAVPSAEDVARLERDGLEVGISASLGEVTSDPSGNDVKPHLAFALARDPRSSRAAYARARAGVLSLPFLLDGLAERPWTSVSRSCTSVR